MEQAILVYVDLEGTPMKVGQLWYVIAMDEKACLLNMITEWLKHPKRFSLDPALKLVAWPFSCII